ncbi:MAG TPA: hypothetical protein VLF62_00695 [Candidatus Saccharimonadales bacterium]|nr:hypothetical protein [Candidatus Saccharimonadales bacterium]
MQKLKKYKWTIIGALLVLWGIKLTAGMCNPNGLDTAFNIAPYVIGFFLLFREGLRHAKSLRAKIVTVILLAVLVAISVFAIFWLNFGNCFTF